MFIFDVVYLHLLIFHFVVVSSFDFQATLPCHWHSTLAREGLHQLWALSTSTNFYCLFFFIYRERYSFEWAFSTHSHFLTYAPSRHFATTCFYQGFSGSRQLFLEICRASYWSLKHRPGPSVCLIHSNPQSFIHLKFPFIHANIAKVLLVVNTLIKNIDQQPLYSAVMKI